MYNREILKNGRFWNYMFQILILFSVFSCSREDVVNGREIPARVITNVNYGEDPQQVYDIYLPQNRSVTTTKVLVLIHGGGWIQGDKRDMNSYIPVMQENHPGYAIVNFNYRLAQPVRGAFPFQFLDLGTALKQITGEAPALGIKPEFALIGASAGGHIALQYDNLYDQGDQVKMVCSIVGPTNFTDPFYSEDPDFKMILEYLIDESQYPGVRDFARAVSPAYLVSENSSPTLLFYGKEDNLVPVSNGIFLKQQLDALGVTVSLTIYNGGHGDWKDEDHRDLILKLKTFINTHLPPDY